MDSALPGSLPPESGTEIMRLGPRALAISTFTVIPLSPAQLSALDAELAGALETDAEDMGAPRAKLRRFKRAGEKGKEVRQALIAARVAAKIAKKKGLKVSRAKAARTAARAAKGGMSLYKAVVAGLRAGGLGQKQAVATATQAIAELRSGGNAKKAKALAAKMRQRRKTRKARKALAKRSSALRAGGQSADRADLPSAKDEAPEFEPSEESELDEGADTEESPEGDDFEAEDSEDSDLSGFSMDTVKPYLPYALLGLGAGVVFYTLRKQDK